LDRIRLDHDIDEICDRFEVEWRAGSRPCLSDLLSGIAGPGGLELFRCLLAVELAYRSRLGEQPAADDYVHQFPEYRREIESVFADEANRTSVDKLDRWAFADRLDEPRDDGVVGSGDTLTTDPSTDDPSRQGPEPAVPTVPGYEIVGELGCGGMGKVLRGRDAGLGRDLAVKVLLGRHGDHPELVRRFVEEAQVTGQLQHPGVVPVYELGQLPDRRPFFAMKLVKGHTLAGAAP
jgi:serine/threonine protein kinase